MSSGLPRFAVSQDGIEDDEEPAHASDRTCFAGLRAARCSAWLGDDDRIGAAGDQGGRH
jgi:hypothetical protein